ncbi:MAG TPA: CocE/NonD family hydrolase [Terriglobales bacterium]|nr:CocE/NonD family hydrolase [Terriglobales bacterium]
MRARLATLVFLLGFVAFPSPSEDDSIRESDVAVPMRDGVVLRADVWRPRGPGPFPTLVYRTPYDRREAVKDYTTFSAAVERGYAVVIQDVRGRYGSGGEYVAYQNEGRDGYETIEWAAQQPWSNGKVGTFGLSYPGAVQWLAAMESPPHLVAMVPAMTYHTPRNFFYSGGVFDLSWIGWIWNNIAPDVRAKKNLPGPRSDDEVAAQWERSRDRMRRHLPLATLPDLKDVAPSYYEWMRHPPSDPWWDWAELRGKFGGTQAAILNLSGWHDEAYGPDGAVNNFAGLVAARGGPHRTAVIVGPWVHGVKAVGRTKSGEREFGPDAALDYDQVVLRWMDHYVRGLQNGVEREKPVRVFTMGANRWHEYETWPPPATQTSFFLATRAAKARSLESRPVRTSRSFSEFVSDPSAPVSDPFAQTTGAHDYRALAERPDVLVFDSAPLTHAMDVTGPIRAEIYFSCDAPDTDLWVRLLDVAPDGAAFNLMSPGLDVLRASHALGHKLVPGRIYRLDFTNLLTSNRFEKGHRVRVQISTAFFPHMSHNLHTGKSEIDSAEMRKAVLRIHHDRLRRSRIVLPVVGKGD